MRAGTRLHPARLFRIHKGVSNRYELDPELGGAWGTAVRQVNMKELGKSGSNSGEFRNLRMSHYLGSTSQGRLLSSAFLSLFIYFRSVDPH